MKNFIVIVLILLLAVVGGIGIAQRQGQAKLRLENESLQQQLAQLPRLRADNEQLSNRLAEATAGANTHMTELLKLRAEVTKLRQPAAQPAESQNRSQPADAVPARHQAAQTASTAKPAHLGKVRLINLIPNQFYLGGVKWTLTPTLYGNGSCNIKAMVQFKNAGGQMETATGETGAKTGQHVVLEAGGHGIAFTPNVVPNRGPL